MCDPKSFPAGKVYDVISDVEVWTWYQTIMGVSPRTPAHQFCIESFPSPRWPPTRLLIPVSTHHSSHQERKSVPPLLDSRLTLCLALTWREKKSDILGPLSPDLKKPLSSTLLPFWKLPVM